MDRTAKFRRQHAELIELAREVAGLLDPAGLEQDATDMRRQLARFLGKLKVHAAMEDGALYPELLAHPSPAIREEARRLEGGLAPLYGRFDALGRDWLGPGEIEAAPARFVVELTEGFSALRHRMSEEHAHLYPLVAKASVAA